MFTLYRGRSHTKNQNNFKPKISFHERKKRTARKKLMRLFPNGSFPISTFYLTIKTFLTPGFNWLGPKHMGSGAQLS